ncbi:hypothetical protein Fmac_011394 [Flemingia macrophylla]|uniref:Uncharacterized protein n=1 Tax=Flemingia macrophylla TaxID=520843 RepID=A0ABD1MN36_9FABA
MLSVGLSNLSRTVDYHIRHIKKGLLHVLGLDSDQISHSQVISYWSLLLFETGKLHRAVIALEGVVLVGSTDFIVETILGCCQVWKLDFHWPYLELQTSALDVLVVAGKIRKRSTTSMLEEKPSSNALTYFPCRARSPPIPSRPPPESHRDSHPKSHCHATSATALTCGPSPFSLSCPFTPLRRPLPGPPHLSLLPPPIREAVRAERTAHLVLLNYSKDGSPFWILLRVSPVFAPAPPPSSTSSSSRSPSSATAPPPPSTTSPSVAAAARKSSPTPSPISIAVLFFKFCLIKSDLGMLLRLDLSSNKLFGSIPISLADAPSLKVLDVQKNTLLNPERIGGVFKQEVQVHNGFLSAYDSVAYFVGVQIEDDYKNEDGPFLSPEKRQLSVVGVVKVAVRSLSMTAGSSKS